MIRRFKPGDKLLCIKDYTDLYTNGLTYSIDSIVPSSKFGYNAYIRCDSNQLRITSKGFQLEHTDVGIKIWDYFLTISEYREKRLNKILGGSEV